MGLKQGMTNNPAGRPKGSENKTTREMRSLITDFLSNNWEAIQDDFDSLTPKDRLTFYEKLLQYGLPKLQSTQLTTITKEQEEVNNECVLDQIAKSILSEEAH